MNEFRFDDLDLREEPAKSVVLNTEEMFTGRNTCLASAGCTKSQICTEPCCL